MSIRKLIFFISLMTSLDLFGQVESKNTQATPIIEIRSYNLKSGRREELHKLFTEKALPMLHRWKIEVVAYGPSLHDANSYYLIRAYKDLNEMNQKEGAFYGSDEWTKGPQDAILNCIGNYTTVVLPASEGLIENLKMTKTSATK